MGDENDPALDNQGTDDEKLDDLLSTQGDEPLTPDGANPPAETSGEGDDPQGSPDLSPSQTPSDDGDQDEDIDESSTDPKDIAIRNLRNKNRRLKNQLKSRQTPESPDDSDNSPEPTPKKSVRFPIADRFLENEFRSNVLFASQDDPTVVARKDAIHKIMFVEMPYLLEKPDGFQIANDLAKGRTIKVVVKPGEKPEVNPQTTPARAAGAGPKVKPLSQDEYNRLPEDQRAEYENSQFGKK